MLSFWQFANKQILNLYFVFEKLQAEWWW